MTPVFNWCSSPLACLSRFLLVGTLNGLLPLANAVLLGYKPIPEQTGAGHARDQGTRISQYPIASLIRHRCPSGIQTCLVP